MKRLLYIQLLFLFGCASKETFQTQFPIPIVDYFYEVKGNKTFFLIEFQQPSPNKIKLEKNECGNYAGTGGLICHSSLFLNDDFFDCPEEYWIIDDLWLSFYILTFTDLKIQDLKTDIKFILDRKATFMTIGNLKQEFSDKFIIPVSRDLGLKL